jgi:ArsR family transcriptional regulator
LVVKEFKALADRNRLRIAMLLLKSPACVCELAFVLGLTQPAVSRHLKKLKEAELVESAQESFWTNYRLSRQVLVKSSLLKILERGLSGDQQIKSDRQRIKRAERTKLCCRPQK